MPLQASNAQLRSKLQAAQLDDKELLRCRTCLGPPLTLLPSYLSL